MNVAVARNKINQLHELYKIFIFQKRVKSTYTLYPETSMYFCILHVNKYITENRKVHMIKLSYL